MSAALRLIPLRCDAVHRESFTFTFLLMVQSCIQRCVSLEDFLKSAEGKRIVKKQCVCGLNSWREANIIARDGRLLTHDSERKCKWLQCTLSGAVHLLPQIKTSFQVTVRIFMAEWVADSRYLNTVWQLYWWCIFKGRGKVISWLFGKNLVCLHTGPFQNTVCLFAWWNWRIPQNFLSV